MLLRMSWKQRSEIARYFYRRSKKRAKRRIHKIERSEAKKLDG